MTSRVPTRIGAYELVREIGRGGMGVVYLAHDTRLDRPVAIKTLPEHLASDADRLERLTREARSLAQLSHPNVAGVYGLETQDGARYVILEYVPGDTLADRLANGPLPLDDTLDVTVQIASGLEAAHDAGIVHRDLKPANVKITPEGAVKVLDFGLAKVDGSASSLSAPARQSAPTLTSPGASPTLPGVILGTAAYMSPEQARGKRVDKRSDIWSFGVVLYECLTGQSPFVGETVSDSIGAILHKDVDFSRLPEVTSPGVRHALRRCLARDPAKRYHEIADVRLDLEDARGHQDDARALRPASSLGARTGWVVAGVLAVTLAALLAWGLMTRERGPAPVVRSAVLAPDGTSIQLWEFAPDGMRVAIGGVALEVGQDGGPRVASLYLRDLAASSMTKVPHSEGIFTARFSADGEMLAFITRGAEASSVERVMRLPADQSAAPVEVMKVPGPFRSNVAGWFCWTPDGHLGFLDRTEGVLGVFDSGTGRLLRHVPLVAQDAREFGSLAGPFGDRYVQATVQRFTPEGFQFDVGLIDVETGVVTIVVENASSLAEASDGDVLFARRDTIYRSAFDRTQLVTTGPFVPVETGLGTTEPWGDGMFVLARNGTLAFRSGGVQGLMRDIVAIDRAGDTTVWSPEPRAFAENIAISLDGERLAVLIASPGGLYQLWVSDVARPRLRRLLAAPGADYYSPTFTPDGERLVASTWNPSADEPAQLLVVPFDSAEPPRRIHGGASLDQMFYPRTVSADGARVLVHETGGALERLFEVALDGVGAVRQLVEERQIFTPRQAPTDTSLVAYVAPVTGRAEVYVRRIGANGVGPAIPVTTRGAWNVEWAVDPDAGLSLLHFDLGWREWLTPIMANAGQIEIGEPRPTGRLGNVRFSDRATTRDGRHFAIREGLDERAATHIELVQGWLDAIGR